MTQDKTQTEAAPLLNSPRQEAPPGEVVVQGTARYQAGQVLAVQVQPSEAEAMAAEAGHAVVEVPGPELRSGFVRVAGYVTRAWSYSEEEAEDFDFFERRHFASVRAALAAEAAALLEARQERQARADFVARRAAIVYRVQQSEHHSWERPAELERTEKLWGDSRMTGSKTLYGDAERLIYVVSSYDDMPHYWHVADAALAAEAAALL